MKELRNNIESSKKLKKKKIKMCVWMQKKKKKKKTTHEDECEKKKKMWRKNICVIGLYCVKYDLCLIKKIGRWKKGCVWEDIFFSKVFSNCVRVYWKQSTLDVLLCLQFMKYKWAFSNWGKLSLSKRKKMRRLKKNKREKKMFSNKKKIVWTKWKVFVTLAIVFRISTKFLYTLDEMFTSKKINESISSIKKIKVDKNRQIPHWKHLLIDISTLIRIKLVRQSIVQHGSF